MDRVLITCERFADLPALMAFADTNGLGLELQEFSNYPDLLDGAWRDHVRLYRQTLSGFSGELALHGAFLDLFPGSPDRQVVALARERFRTSLRIAAELGAHVVNFHANYLPLIDDPHYLPGWIRRQLAFWQDLAVEAGQLGVTIVLENMWESEPGILGHLVEATNSPFVRACIDIGHACVYSRRPLPEWIETLKPCLVYTHLHNTTGQQDVHLPFDVGVLDIKAILAALRCLPIPPIFCLELPSLADIRASLPFLNL